MLERSLAACSDDQSRRSLPVPGRFLRRHRESSSRGGSQKPSSAGTTDVPPLLNDPPPPPYCTPTVHQLKELAP
ncbi:hypothetical protein CSOJ01_07060 [Colletotrichum sojae]|uniref:Uncharacterized protein n=1 Tax=Colletotrichum sojae TaxID=2175907 RepID=A0A8H6JA38_9PEZI|nr:hypothetical protein CSOJ01_07060 [Colletotrichum sojae]